MCKKLRDCSRQYKNKQFTNGLINGSDFVNSVNIINNNQMKSANSVNSSKIVNTDGLVLENENSVHIRFRYN